MDSCLMTSQSRSFFYRRWRHGASVVTSSVTFPDGFYSLPAESPSFSEYFEGLPWIIQLFHRAMFASVDPAGKNMSCRSSAPFSRVSFGTAHTKPLGSFMTNASNIQPATWGLSYSVDMTFYSLKLDFRFLKRTSLVQTVMWNSRDILHLTKQRERRSCSPQQLELRTGLVNISNLEFYKLWFIHKVSVKLGTCIFRPKLFRSSIVTHFSFTFWAGLSFLKSSSITPCCFTVCLLFTALITDLPFWFKIN